MGHWLWRSVFAGSTLGLAWLLPGTVYSALLGNVAIAALIFCVHCEHALRACYVAACIALAIGFYWLPNTVQMFGGFDPLPAYAVQLLFVFGSSVQFIIFVFLVRRSRPVLGHLGLAPAFAWVASEWLWLRIFPWEYAHTQIAFTSFVQIADIAGTAAITIVLFSFWESLYQAITRQRFTTPLALNSILIVVCISYGAVKRRAFDQRQAPTVEVALVQANISVEEKRSVKFFKKNTADYLRLTNSLTAQKKELLVLWPETVIQDWIPNNVGSVHAHPALPRLSNNSTLVAGALTYDEQDRRYNSALVIDTNGEVPTPYHKRILMPFGEYMPGGQLFPWLQDLNPMAQGFTAGAEQSVFNVQHLKDGVSLPLRIAALICYEDVLPSLSRAAVQRGANVLVNLTNDAWFGNSHAPFQHHLIASFRAIESGRYLLRSTNSGLSAVVSPLGVTTAQLPVFTEGILSEKIQLLDDKTLYSKIIGNFLRYVVLFVLLCILVFRRKRNVV